MLKEELSLKSFKLSYKRTTDFVESKWFSVPIVLAYRSFLALFCSTWIVYGAATSKINAKTFLYLTDWTYASITTYFILSVILTALHYTQGTKTKEHQRLINQTESESEFYDERERTYAEVTNGVENEMKWYHRFIWVLLNISSNMSLCVTISFWTLIYDGKAILISDIFIHILNSVFMVLEIVLSSVPIRLLHLIYPFIFGFIYVLMTVIYWLFIDKTAIYVVIDYTHKPGEAAEVILGSHLILVPLVQMFLYTVYRLRDYLSAKYSKSSE